MKLKNKLCESLLWRFLKTLKNFKPRRISLALILMIFSSFTEGISLLLLIPLLQLVGLNVQQGALGEIDQLIVSFFNYLGLEPTLSLVLLIYVLVVSLAALINKFQVVESSKIQYEFAANLRKKLFKQITNSSWIFFTRNKSSDFTHALTNEIERISMLISQFLILLSSLFILMVYLIFALTISGLVTGLVFVVGIILLVLLKKRTEISISRGEEITKSTQDLYQTTTQHLDGMKTVKSFNMGKRNILEFSRIVDEVTSSYIKTILSYTEVKLFFDIGSVIILSLIVYLLINIINISTAELLILLFIFIRIIPYFSSIQGSYQYFINSLPAFASVMDLKEKCQQASEAETEAEKVDFKKEIQFNNVSFNYPEKKESFHLVDLNLKIEAGKTTALVGLSGAGKTTIADLLMGLLKPSSGEILINSDTLNSKNISSWRSMIGYVAQDTFLFNDTVRNNLLFANPQASDQDLLEALEMASAYNFVLKLPKKFDTLIGDRGVTLSGGEKQRLALARALVAKPSLLILDEATSDLDSKNEQKIMSSIEQLHGNLTILIIAHRLSAIRNADMIYLMEEGEIVESGKWDSLISKDKGFFRFLYEAQS